MSKTEAYVIVYVFVFAEVCIAKKKKYKSRKVFLVEGVARLLVCRSLAKNRDCSKL